MNIVRERSYEQAEIMANPGQMKTITVGPDVDRVKTASSTVPSGSTDTTL